MSVVLAHCLACGVPMNSADTTLQQDCKEGRVIGVRAMAFCTNCKATYSVELQELRPPVAGAPRNVNT